VKIKVPNANVINVPSVNVAETVALTPEEERDSTKQINIAERPYGEKSLKQTENEAQAFSFDSLKSQITNTAKTEKIVQAEKLVYDTSISPEKNVESLTSALEGLRVANETPEVFEKDVINGVTFDILKDPQWRDIIEKTPTEMESLSLLSSKQLLLQNKEAHYRKMAEDRGWLNYAVDLAATFLTPLDFISSVIATGEISYADKLEEMGKRFNNARSVEEAQLVLEEFDEEISAAYFLINNEAWTEDQLAIAFRSDPSQIANANAFGYAEIFFTGLGIKGSSIFRNQTSATLKDLGETKSLISDKIENKEVYDTIGLSVSDDVDLQPFGKIQEELKRNERILDDMEKRASTPSTERFLDTEEKGIIRNLISKEVNQDFTKAKLGNFRVNADNTVTFDLYNKENNPYSSQGYALRALKDKGLEGVAVKLKSGGWVARANVDSQAVKDSLKLAPKQIGRARRLFDNIDNWVMPDFVSKGRLSEGVKNALESGVKKVALNSWGKLNKKSKASVSRVIQKNQDLVDEGLADGNNVGWFTIEQFKENYQLLNGKAPTDAEVLSYGTYKQVNDFMWKLDNKAARDSLVNQGLNKLEGDGIPEGVNAKIAGATSKGKVYDVTTGETFELDSINKQALASMDILRIDRNSVDSFINAGNMKGNPAELIALPKGTYTLSELDLIQKPYLAGGRRGYDANTIWIKQARLGNYSDGTSYRLRDKTLFSADSMPEANEFVDKFNKGLGLLKNMESGLISRAVAKESFDGIEMGITFDEFIGKVADNDISLDTNLVPLRNRETIDIQGDYTDFSDTPKSLGSSGSKYDKRGEVVPNINGDTSNITDPFESLSRSFDVTSNNVAFSEYKDFTLKRFKEVFGKYVVSDNRAPITNLLEAGVTSKGKKLGLEETIKGHQVFLKELLGYQNGTDRVFQQKVENIVWKFTGKAEKLGVLDPTKRSKVTASVSESLSNPTGTLRNITFNAKLGMFNPASFIIQALHAPVIVAMSPKYGMKSLSQYFPLRAALISNDPKVVEEISKKLGEEFSDLGDFKELVQEYRALGFESYGGNLAYVDALNGSNALVGGKLSRVAEAGRFFFEEGENIPRMVAYLTARRKWINDNTINPNKESPISVKGKEYISNETHRLTFGMSRIDMQQITKGGIRGIVTQFMSYPMRAIGAFAGKQFTPQEKAGMFLSYFALYGTAGIPILDTVEKYISARDPEAIPESKEVLDKLIFNGIIDGAMLAAFDVDTNISARAGLGTFLTDILDSILTDTPIDFVLGAGGSTTNRAFDTFIDINRAYSAMNNPDLSNVSEAAFLAVAGQVSTFSNAYKAYLGWNTGKLYDSYGRKLAPITTNELVANIAGFTPQVYEDLGTLFAKKGYRQDIIKNGIEDILFLHNRILETDDEEEKKVLLDGIKIRFSDFESDGIKKEVIRGVIAENKRSGYYDNLNRKQQMIVVPEDN